MLLISVQHYGVAQDRAVAVSAAIPEAPSPAFAQVPGQADAQQAQPSTPTPAVRYAPIYDRTVFPGEQALPLTDKEKFIFAGRQMIEPINLTPAIFSAAFGQIDNGDPKYGTDSAAFGERFGAAVVRQDSYRLLADGVMPILLHEDQRYYRLGHGGTLRRLEYSLGQTFVTRNDQGQTVPNYAGFLGRGVAASLTYAYYPAASANAHVVLETFATSIAGLAALNVIRELTPHVVFRKLQSLHLRVTGK